MDRRQFLKGVIASGAAAAVGATALRGTPALASTGPGSTSGPSAAQFLLGTGRRALA
jgi:hypothetical protein